jgi:hypothetical protein
MLVMEKNTSSKLVNQNSERLESSKKSKMIKKFYAQFLESMSRKTEAEKRIEHYGKDPFK